MPITMPSGIFTTLAATSGILCAIVIPAMGQSPAPTPTNPVPPQEDKLRVPIRLTDGQQTITRTRRELGFRQVESNGPVAFTADLGTLKDALTRIAPAFKFDGKDARPTVRDGIMQIQPGLYSRQLNVPTTAQRLYDAVRQNPATTKITVSLDKKPPVITPERLAGITGVLARMVTRTSDNAKRNTNIRIAAEAIDGTLLSPGEVFSLNAVVGKRTQARGYKTANVFVNAEIVPGIGGGVSQITGTLFNAAALAFLPIQEVHPHSRPVAYLPLGRDATVAYGDKDLKFTNNTKTPIFISYQFQGNILTATLYGAKVTGRKVTLTPRVRNLGPGRINAELYRTVREQGKVVAKERLFIHAYRWNANSG